MGAAFSLLENSMSQLFHVEVLEQVDNQKDVVIQIKNQCCLRKVVQEREEIKYGGPLCRFAAGFFESALKILTVFRRTNWILIPPHVQFPVDYKEKIRALFRECEDVAVKVEVPPKDIPGDFAVPCFPLARVRKQNPVQIATECAQFLQPRLADHPEFARVESNGPYVNFFLNPASQARAVLEAILTAGADYGRGAPTGKTIVIEYPAPNTNKPLHLGHIRNMLLGQTIARVLEFRGHDVRQVNLNNDRGIHICKSMLAYQKWGAGRDPAEEGTKPDHFVGEFYVKYAQAEKEDPTLAEEAADLLRAWEAGDPATRALWDKMRQWALAGFHETYAKFGVAFTKEYYESDLYTHGKEIVQEGLAAGTFARTDDGAVYAPLEPHGLPDKILLRSDGTAVYMTQDLYLAYKKYTDFQYQLSVYVVGNEQRMHFQRLFTILDLLEAPGNNYHLAYGMIALPEGKMKSREGTVVDADDFVAEMIQLAREEVAKRHPALPPDEVDARARKIGMAALRFFILRYDPARDFVFDPKESISFEGETGPYVQYVYARISSILRKAGVTVAPALGDFDPDLLQHEKEVALITLLEQLPSLLERVDPIHAEGAISDDYKVHLLARYLLDLCQAFNEFYHNCPVIQAEPARRAARIALIEAVRAVVAVGLGLLGIETPEKM